MFTLEEIKTVHAKVKSGADFPHYIQEIKQLGVACYETFVTDGHTIFKGHGSYFLQSMPKYKPLVIADESDDIRFQQELKEHQQGKTDYLEFCEISARLGVEKWVVDIPEMTCTYYSKSHEKLLVETIPPVG